LVNEITAEVTRPAEEKALKNNAQKLCEFSDLGGNFEPDEKYLSPTEIPPFL